MEHQKVTIVHKISNISSEEKDSLHFHCPVSSCIYAEGSERYFTTKRQLSQHNVKVHAEKKYTCSKCQKGFGMEWHRKHHETTCGQEWKCSCGQLYSCRESLLTHARRTQHHLPAHIRHLQRRQSSKNVQIQQVVVPLVLVIQSPPQQVPVSPSVSCSARKQRVILPKTVVPPPPPPPSVHPVPVLSLKEHSQNEGLSKSSVAVQTDNSSGSIPLCGNTQTISSPSDLPDPLLYKIEDNFIYSKTDLANFSPFTTEIGGRNKRQRIKTAAETQTTGDDILNKAIHDAHLLAKRESRASQCSGRVRGRRQSVRIESTETQTTESALVKIKKRNTGSRSRKNSVAVSVEFDNTTMPSTNPNGHSLWSSLETMIFEDFNNKQSLWNITPTSSSGTQTSPQVTSVKDLCDSQTITDEQLFTQLTWPSRESEENGTLSDMTPNLSSERNLIPEQSESTSTPNPLLQLLSDNSSFTFHNESNNPSNCELGAQDIYISQNSDLCLNTETQTEFNTPLLPDTMVQQAVQTETFEPPYSHIQTQTGGNLDLDYSSVLAHMETQTTDDFLFSQLEFSDIETQTPWDDISSLNDSFEAVDHFSIEIQTDFNSLPELTSEQGAYHQYLMNDHENLSETSSRHSATLTDTETQTNYEFPTTDLISSYAQTLDLQLSHDMFYS